MTATNDAVNNLLNDVSDPTGDGIERNQWGQPVVPDPTTGEIRSWRRPSTLAGVLENERALNTWETRGVAYGIAHKVDAYSLAASVATCTTPEDKAQLDEAIEIAKEFAGLNESRRLGSGLHNFLRRVHLGENDVYVPDEWQPSVKAYLEYMQVYGIWPHGNGQYVERFVVVPELGAAGSFDGLWHGDGWKLPRVGDIKTGQVKGKGRNFGIQLGTYALGSALFKPDERTFEDMPEVDQEVGLIIHLPIGEAYCDFYEVDLVAGRKLAYLAVEVLEARKRNDLCKPLSKWVPAPSAEPAETSTPVTPEPEDSEAAPDAPAKPKRKRRTKAEMQAAREAAGEVDPVKVAAIVPITKEIADGGNADDVREDAPPAEVERENTLTVPTIDPQELFGARFRWAKERVQYVAITHGQAQQLAEVWSQACADVPTFRNGGPRTDEEIDRVAGVCGLVEMAEQLPFFEPDPAKQKADTKWLTGETRTNEQYTIS